jgi:hypothetical protein
MTSFAHDLDPRLARVGTALHAAAQTSTSCASNVSKGPAQAHTRGHHSRLLDH